MNTSTIPKTVVFISILFSLTASATPLGAICSALIAGLIIQKFGCKMTLLLSAGLTFLSFVLVAVAKTLNSPELIIASRAIMGLTVGLCMPSTTTYVRKPLNLTYLFMYGASLLYEEAKPLKAHESANHPFLKLLLYA